MRVRYLLRWLFGLPILLYRRLVSPLLPPSCIYTPTCSAYAHEAILKHGIIRGTILGAARIGRCAGGLFHGGSDAVPEVFTLAAVTGPYRAFWRRRRGGLHDGEADGRMGPEGGER